MVKPGAWRLLSGIRKPLYDKQFSKYIVRTFDRITVNVTDKRANRFSDRGLAACLFLRNPVALSARHASPLR